MRNWNGDDRRPLKYIIVASQREKTAEGTVMLLRTPKSNPEDAAESPETQTLTLATTKEA
jgi:hypothetical protein